MVPSNQESRIWRQAMKLVVKVCARTRGFPGHKVSGPTRQIRRAAFTQPSDVAENKGRSSDHDRDRAHFFCHARALCLNLESQILIAQQQEHLSSSQREKLIANSAQLGRMIHALIQSMRDSETTRKPSAQPMVGDREMYERHRSDAHHSPIHAPYGFNDSM
jgi:four helix bundle protein